MICFRMIILILKPCVSQLLDTEDLFSSLFMFNHGQERSKTKVVQAVRISRAETDEGGKYHSVILGAGKRRQKCGTYPILHPTSFSDVLILVKYKESTA